MKIREIILDFTSLLDVIMIILFFFILFSTIEVESVSQSAEEARISYETLREETEQEQAEFRERADEEWERILQADANAAINQQALTAFDQGAVLAFNLQEMETSSSWKLNIVSGDTRLGSVSPSADGDLAEEIMKLLAEAGFQKGDVIISTLTYDGNAPGTAVAVPMIGEAVGDLQEAYRNLYFAAINVSK